MPHFTLRQGKIEAIRLREMIYVPNPNTQRNQPKYLGYGPGWFLGVMDERHFFMNQVEFDQRFQPDTVDGNDFYIVSPTESLLAIERRPTNTRIPIDK